MTKSWCSCFAKTTSTPPPCTKNGSCVYAPDMLISGETSVYPCGADETNGIITITDKVRLSNNGKTATYKIESNSVNLMNVLITEDEITFEASYDPNTEGSSHVVGFIEYSVTQGGLKDFGRIDIIFKSRCEGVDCANEDYCDPCTGNCIPKEVDISVGDTSGDNTTTDIQIG